MKRETINYTLVGFAVLIAFGLLLLSLFIITGRGGAAVSYYVQYDNVTGLSYGDPVFYEGFRIGQVTAIEPVRVQSKTGFRVELAVQEDWPIPVDSVAQLSSSGLLADVAIAISEGSSSEIHLAGSDIIGRQAADIFGTINSLAGEVNALAKERISPLIEKLSVRLDSIAQNLDESTPQILADAKTLLQRLNLAADSVNDVLSPGNKQEISQSLRNIREVTGALKQTQTQLDGLLVSLNQVSEENRPVLRKAISDLSLITDSIARRIDSISHNLESSSRNFNEFTREIRKSPNRLLVTPKPDDVVVEKE